MIIIASVWIAFFSTLLIQTASYPIGVVLVASVLSCCLSLFFDSIIKKITALSNHIKKINETNNIEAHISLQGSDEIAQIGININKLLNTIKNNHATQQENKQNKINELKTLTQQLKHEISDLKPIAGKSLKKNELPFPIHHYEHETELPNHNFFNKILKKSIKHAHRYKTILGILLLDISEYKQIESVLGHDQSNDLLQVIGKKLESVLRTEDIIAKLDDGAFIILLTKIEQPKFASIVAEKLLSVFSQPIDCLSQAFSLNANIGVCTYPNDGSSLDELLKNIDTALYRAKNIGDGVYQFYNPEMDIAAHEFIQLETALHQSISNNELILYYQPKLNLKKGKIVGLEALLRWTNPNFGTIYPGTFIPLAEETGFHMQIADWVIREACKMTKSCQNEGYEHIAVSVNLSAKQFYHSDIVGIISRALDEFKLNPKYLEIEIDEKTVMDNVVVSNTTLSSIKTTGVQIAIDHFGTGYTSISYLKKFSINIVKIDSDFIKGVPNNPNDSAITSSFIALAHKLGLEVVAEGVETSEQVQYLASENCDMIQGYFLSHALPEKEIKLQIAKISEEALI